MGFEIDNASVKTNFQIKSSFLPIALLTLKEVILNKENLSGWIDPDEVEKALDFKSIMAAVGWPVEISDSGDVVKIRHDGLKVAEEKVVFETLAPFVENGAYIEYEREGFTRDIKLKYIFQSGCFIEREWGKDYDASGNEIWIEFD